MQSLGPTGSETGYDAMPEAASGGRIVLPRLLRDRGHLAQAALMLTAVSAVHSAAWIYQNTLPWDWPKN